MSLRKMEISKVEYESLVEDIICEFYIPCLKESIEYKRAVAYFSSNLLISMSEGLASLAKKGGSMKLLLSYQLNDEDYDAMKKGYDKRQLIEDKIESDFNKIFELAESRKRLELLSYMISSRLLDIKIAIINKNEKPGIYHEKLGLFIDDDDNIICYSGSANETLAAFESNYEKIDVFYSWSCDNDKLRITKKEMNFTKLWTSGLNQVLVIPFPDVVKNRIIKEYKPTNNDYLDIDEELLKKYVEEKKKREKAKSEDKNIPKIGNIKLHSYQKKAIEQWKINGYHGIFDMATGTGKTFTACGAICELAKEQTPLFVVICCPYLHLVDQWADEVKLFNINPIVCYGNQDYQDQVKRAVFAFKLKKSKFACLICANKTFASEFIQNQLDQVINQTLLIVDEAHNFGAEKISQTLEKDYRYRIGLSATIERYGDEEGTRKLKDFFGDYAINYSLEQAIIDKALTPYKYYPVIVNLDDEELEEYLSLTNKIRKCIMNDSKDSDYCKKLLLKRTRIISGCKNKIEKLKEIIAPYKNDNNMLIYCGAIKYKSTDEKIDTNEIKQIQVISEMLYKNFKMKTSQFTSNESAEQRANIKKSFINKGIQAIVAIKCLDEGVNIPGIRTAFILASSTNPKEYIQRRGRVLRLAKGKEYAIIYDFITLPVALNKVKYYSEEQINSMIGLVNRELKRYDDFMNLSQNTLENISLRDEILEKYGLSIIKEGDMYE